MTKQDESHDESVVDEKVEYDEYVAAKESAVRFTKKIVELFQEVLDDYEKAKTADEISAALMKGYELTARIARTHMMADVMSDMVVATMEQDIPVPNRLTH